MLSLFTCGPTGWFEVREQQAKPQRATTGTVRGEVRWNGRGVPDNEIMLSEDVERVTSDELTLSWAPYPDAARYTVTLRASGEHRPR